MHKDFRNPTCKIGASSMVFGNDMVENAVLLSRIVDHVEIVLFHTKGLDNIPVGEQVRQLEDAGRRSGISYSVHLPASLEIGAPDPRKRKEDIRLIRDICRRMADLKPLHYVLHVPFSPPTLVAVPGLYFKSNGAENWEDWTKRSLESLSIINEEAPESSRFLVENINYSPRFLKPFVESGLCGLCLDIGHLVLGGEPAADILEENLSWIEEIHIHGVKGREDHLCVSLLQKTLLRRCLECLVGNGYGGVLNMEVFTPEDLTGSIGALRETMEEIRADFKASYA